eukprot:6416271-Alexandrium_andersonii.AAC.1
MPSRADTGPTTPAYVRTGTFTDPLPAAHAVGRSTSLRTGGTQDRRTTRTDAECAGGTQAAQLDQRRSNGQ